MNEELEDKIVNKIQVEPNHYDFSYDSEDRLISYYHQIDEVIGENPKNVLEIGIGNGFVSNYLRRKGIDITTADIDKRLNPDIVGSVTDLPIDDDSFEVVTAFEVLEHLPFEDFGKSLRELRRISRSKVIISLPDRSKYFRLYVKIPCFWHFKKLIDFGGKFTNSLWNKSVEESEEHHWEIGIEGYPIRRIIRSIENVGLSIEKDYRIFKKPYHRFFVLDVKDSRSFVL